MDIFGFFEKMMGMDDATWRRHANPLSVYTRFTCLPLIVLAIWSRVWLGWWSLVPIILSLVWTWLNPRLFSEPRSLDNWASKGVMGERVFLDRKNRNIPAHHSAMTKVLSLCSAVCFLVLAYGLFVLSFWPTFFGLVTTIVFKVWFVDRMVWIYEDETRNPVD